MMASKVSVLLATILLACAGNISAAENEWYFGVGVMMESASDKAPPEANAGGFTVNAIEDANNNVSIRLYGTNAETANWTYYGAYYPGLTTTFDVDGSEVTFEIPILEFGVLYDWMHSKSGWFADLGIGLGIALSDEVTPLSSTVDLHSGYETDYPYTKFELGIGKTVGQWVVRFNYSITALDIGSYIIDNGTPAFGEQRRDDVIATGLTVSYWW